MADPNEKLISGYRPSNLSQAEKEEYLSVLKGIEDQQTALLQEIPRFTADSEDQKNIIARIIAEELRNKGFDVNVSGNEDKFTDKNVSELMTRFREQLSAPSGDAILTLDSVSRAED